MEGGWADMRVFSDAYSLDDRWLLVRLDSWPPLDWGLAADNGTLPPGNLEKSVEIMENKHLSWK